MEVVEGECFVSSVLTKSKEGMQYNEFTNPTVGKQIILSNQIKNPTIGRIRVVLWKKILDRVMNTRQLLVWKMGVHSWGTATT